MSPNGESDVRPRPVASAAACLEFAAGWLVLLLAGFALIVALLLVLQDRESQALRASRLHITLHEIEGRIEADLALGYELREDARAQSLIEDALAHDPALLSAEVFDARGVSVFNTDRGSIGEQVPQAWVDAGRAPQRAGEPWLVSIGDERTLGTPLQGPFGEVTGHLSLTVGPAPHPPPAAFLAAAFGIAALLVAGAWLALRRVTRKRVAQLDPAAVDAAAQRLAAAHERLDKALFHLTNEEGAAQ